MQFVFVHIPKPYYVFMICKIKFPFKLLKYDKLAKLMLLKRPSFNCPYAAWINMEIHLGFQFNDQLFLGLSLLCLRCYQVWILVHQTVSVLSGVDWSLDILYRQSLIYADQLSITFIWSTTTGTHCTLIQQPFALFTFEK